MKKQRAMINDHMKHIIKKIVYFALYSFMAVCLCALVYMAYVWSINLHDKPLSETSLEFQNRFNSIHKQTLKINGHVTLLSFSDFETSESLQSEKLSAFREACYEADSCVQTVFQEKFLLNDLLSQYNPLLELYAQLISHTAYSDIDHIESDTLPSFSEVLLSQKLYLINILNPESDLSPAAVRQALDRDLHFWRLALSDSVTFISKMIAISALNNHFQFTNALYRNLSIEDIDNVLPKSLFIPLSKEELSLDRVMIGEWHYMTSFFSENSNAERDESSFSINRVTRFNIFHTQDTMNLLAEHTAIYMAHFDRPIEEYPQAKSHPPAINTRDDFWSLLLDPYNPGGKMMASLALPAYENYFLQLGDVEVARRALALVSQMRHQGIFPHEASTYIAQSDIKHPYQGEEFKWDAEQKALVFFTSESENDRLSRFVF